MERIYASIDIGSDTAKMLVAEFIDNKINVLASASTQTKGIRNGIISNESNALNTLKELITIIEGKLGGNIQSVLLNIIPHGIQYNIVEGFININREDKKIKGNDIIRVLKNSINKKIPDIYEIVTIMPIDFILDDDKKIKDPKGLSCNKLGVKAMVVTTLKKELYDLLSLFQTLDIEVEDINISPIADYYEFKNKELDKSLCAIVNIGHDITNIGIFNKGIIINSEILPIGGKNIENDISYIYKVSKEDSIKIKESFAVAHKKASQIEETLETININNEITKITQYDLSNFVMSRVEEMMEMIKKEIELLTNKEIKYIIFTGGTSELSGIQYVLKEIFEDKAKLGKINTIGIRHNKYSTVSGMIKYYDEKLKLRDKVSTMIILNKNKEKKKRIKIEDDSILTKFFGYFVNN